MFQASDSQTWIVVTAVLGGISTLAGMFNTYVISDIRSRLGRLEDRAMGKEGK
jgi:hypothetical protein